MLWSTVGRNNRILVCSSLRFTVNYHLRDGMDIANLEETEVVQNWGVWIDINLQWSQQCRKGASKAMSLLGMIRMSLKQIDIDRFRVAVQYKILD